MSKKRRGNRECVESQLEEAESRQEESGPFGCGKRRENDIGVSISCSKKFHKHIKWRPKYNSLKYILRTAYEWEKKLSYIK